MRSLRSRPAALLLAPLLALAGCGTAAAPDAAAPEAARAAVNGTQVLVISVDALNPTALTRLGREELPHLWRLLDEGAATLNARTERELTLTLPNHTGMVTGRRIDARAGGHGVTWNSDRPGTTVQRAAGHAVASVFSTVHAAGGDTALFSTKTKFSLFERSWPVGVDRILVREEQDVALVRAARADLVQRQRDLTFLHLGIADQTGHERGFLSPAYLDAVRLVDTLVGRMLSAVESTPGLEDTTVVLTSDHGGRGADHYDPTRLYNYRVPFVAWGPGIEPRDLYALNPAYRSPGSARTTYAGPQPVRNGDVANLVTSLLGIGPVPGSRFGVEHPLRVSAAPPASARG